MSTSRLVKFFGAAAATLVMSACGPRDYRDCMNEASTKPTDTGVRVAIAQCAKRFPDQAAAQHRNDGLRPFDGKLDGEPNMFDDLVPEKPIPEWLRLADVAVRKFDEMLGIPPAKNRGEHLIKRFVQLAVVLSLVAYFYFRFGKKK